MLNILLDLLSFCSDSQLHCFVIFNKCRTKKCEQEALTANNNQFPISQKIQIKRSDCDCDSPLHWLVFLSRIAFVDTIFPYLQKTKKNNPLQLTHSFFSFQLVKLSLVLSSGLRGHHDECAAVPTLAEGCSRRPLPHQKTLRKTY